MANGFSIAQDTPGSSYGVPPSYAAATERKLFDIDPVHKQIAKDHPALVAVMGATGTGKSTFISQLAGKNVQIGHDLRSYTTDIQEFPCQVGDQKVWLLDTPGFNDTNQAGKKDVDILQSLTDWLKQAAGENVRLSGIIYLHEISQARMTGTSVANLKMFRALCGDKNLKNVILATTKWEITPKADAELRESQLKEPEGFWGVYIRFGAKIRRFQNTKEGASVLIEEILRTGKDRFTPLVQEEMTGGKELADTQAGMVLQHSLAEIKAKFEKEKAAMREEYESAQRDRDHTNMKFFTDLLEKAQQRIEEQEKAQERLKESERETYRRRILELEEQVDRKEKQETPHMNKKRMFHSRYRCALCRSEKTDQEGIWRCPNCYFLQDNIPNNG